MAIKLKIMNILCNEVGFVGKFVKQGDLGLPQRRQIAMREIGPKWGSLPPPNGGALAAIYIESEMQFYMIINQGKPCRNLNLSTGFITVIWNEQIDHLYNYDTCITQDCFI